jgi:surface polysaccharide O-acyltransferase-like enzyme
MYIGLFLFIPFLNVLYNNLKDKKEKLLLIATMCLLTSLPGFINQIAFISNIRLMILPDWWMGIYPITYYFVGAYLYEFQPKIKKLFNFIALIIVLVSQAGLYYIECRGGVLEYTFKVSYNGTFLSLIAAILLFTLIYDINIKNKVARFFITDFSLLSFEIYLASYISDYFIYPYFTGRYFITEQQFLKYYLIIVPLSFLMSYSIAFLRRLLINKTLRRVRKFNQ